MKEKGNRKEQEGGIIRVSAHTKERLEQLRHPGQSYDGFLEEALDYWGETHPKEIKKQKPVQRPAEPTSQGKEPDKASWWWWPEKNTVRTDDEEVNNKLYKRR